MKKEIWKLIELLNEYREKELWYRVPEWEEKWQPWIITEQLISKKFWFIKWLVENDKIDLENLQCVFSWNINKWKTLMEETDWYERYEWTEYEATESLIMLLSISDTPIDDLISYLK